MPNQTPIPHPTDRNLSLVPHVHGRGFAVIERAKPKARLIKLKHVGIVVLVLAGLGLSAYGPCLRTHVEQALNIHVLRACP